MALLPVSTRTSAASSEPEPTPNGLSLIRLPKLLQRVPKSKAWIYQSIKEGSFPAPINIGARSVAWVESEIDDWIKARIQSSRRRHPETVPARQAVEAGRANGGSK